MVRGLNEGSHLPISLVVYKGWERKGYRGNGVPRRESGLSLKNTINEKRWRMLEILVMYNSEFQRALWKGFQ